MAELTRERILEATGMDIDPRVMSKKDRKAMQEILEVTEALKRDFEEAKRVNPFWYYEPSDGTISEDGFALMRDYLKPDDIPSPGGLDSQLDVHTSTASIVGAFGGNQGGKTTTGAIEAFIKVTGKVPYAMKDVYPKEKLRDPLHNRGEPIHVRVVGVDYQTFKMNLLPTYEKWAPREYLPDGEFWKGYSSEDRILHLVYDRRPIGTIEFKTNEQKVESFQGPPRHKIIYDEEPRYDIHKENLMRFTTASRLDILFNMTPTRGLSWVHDEVVLKQDRKDIQCFKIPSITNKRANLEVLREILDGMTTYEEVKMRLLGEFVSLSGLVYGNLFNEKLHLIEPFEINKDDFIVYRGLDPHLVKPSACLELAMDREENEYVCGAYLKDVDTETLKEDLARRAHQRNYRLGWTQCDKSADSTIKILNERNVYKELCTGRYAIPALFKSDKFVGSIHAGVDTIKRRLKPDPDTGKPQLVIFNIPEMDQLISALKTMERDRGLREEDTGKVDKIKEGKWDLHACLRYMHQRKMRWLPREQPVPEYIPENEAIGY